jgi:Holliday junction resolvasome RuvABC DNA-binding subunit
MISSVTGKVKGISSNSVVIEVGGVGILVNVPLRVIETLSIGNLVDLHTHLIKDQVESALQGLGYTPKESRLMVSQSLNQLPSETIDIASAIKLALAANTSGKTRSSDK